MTSSSDHNFGVGEIRLVAIASVCGVALLLWLGSQLKPDNGEAWSYLAAARDSLADPDGTLHAAEKAARLRPDSAPDHLLLATVYMRADRGAEARREFEQAIRLAPRSAAAHREYVAWLLKYAPGGDGATRAVVEARQAVNLDAGDARAQLLFGRALARSGDRRSAIAPLALAAREPDNPEPARELWQLHRILGDPTEAERWQKEYLARENYVMTRRQLLEAIETHPDQTEPHRRLAHLLALHGDVEECVRQYAAALRCAPDAPQALGAAARDLLGTGAALQAVPLARQAVERAGANPDLNELLGDALLATDQAHDAAVAYQAAADVQPERMERLRARLKAYFERRKAQQSLAERTYMEAERSERSQIGPRRITPKVEALAQQAVNLEPQNPRYLRYLLHIQTARRYHEQAILTARCLLALQPEDATAHATLAILLLENAVQPDELAEVETHLRAVNGPDLEATRHYGLGLLALKRHEAASAVQELERSVQLDPTSELGYYKLAQAETLAGNAKAAHVAMAEHARIQGEKSREANLLGDIALHPDMRDGYQRAISYFRGRGLIQQAEAIRGEARRRFGISWYDANP